jgi:hypothetical protein
MIKGRSMKGEETWKDMERGKCMSNECIPKGIKV